MGLSQFIRFPAGVPSWDVLRDHLVACGLSVQLRMIDGQLAFPDEAPATDWRELRVSLPQGMITLRREVDGLTFVVWGNADTALNEAWNALVRACAELGEPPE